MNTIQLNKISFKELLDMAKANIKKPVENTTIKSENTTIKFENGSTITTTPSNKGSAIRGVSESLIVKFYEE
jgi:hypothetical protein